MIVEGLIDVLVHLPELSLIYADSVNHKIGQILYKSTICVYKFCMQTIPVQRANEVEEKNSISLSKVLKVC